MLHTAQVDFLQQKDTGKEIQNAYVGGGISLSLTTVTIGSKCKCLYIVEKVNVSFLQSTNIGNGDEKCLCWSGVISPFLIAIG